MPREPKPAKEVKKEQDRDQPPNHHSYYYDDAYGYEDYEPDAEAGSSGNQDEGRVVENQKKPGHQR